MIGRTANTALRRSRQLQRPPREVCPLCLEDEHIAGRNHVPNITVKICQPCHATLTEGRFASGADMNKQPNSVQAVEMALRSLAVTGRASATLTSKISEALEFSADQLRLDKQSRRAVTKSRKPDRPARKTTRRKPL